MLTLSSNEQAVELIKDGVLAVDDDIEIAFDGFSIQADIKCLNIYSKGNRRDIKAWNIYAWNIKAWNIYADNINANNITAKDINTFDITAKDINTFDINANNITAKDINTFDINANNIYAFDIEARNIEANNIEVRYISYYAICFSYQNIICESIKGLLKNSRHFSLDGEVIVKEKEENKNEH